METDDRNLEVLVALLGLRSLGGEGIDPKHPLVTTLKKPVAEAKRMGHIEETQVSIPTTNAKGKPTTKKVKVLSITPSGREWITKHASAEQQAATNLGYLTALKSELERDRQKLQEEVKIALSSSSDGEGAFAKELESVTKKLLEAITKQFEKLEQKVPKNDTSGLLAHIDQSFRSLQTRLDNLISAIPTQNGSSTTHVEPKKTLESTLKQAYDKLCLFIEFKDGMVELPRIYHESRKTLPELTVSDFHKELMELWSRREIQLHVLNEVYKAAEPDKGIHHNNLLYYYLLWKRPS